MLLAIISDTHLRAGRSLPERCRELCAAGDAILHAGDLVDVQALEELRSLGPPVHAVRGNIDTPALGAILPSRLDVAFDGVRVGMVHIPGPASAPMRGLPARFPGCDAVIFGHTHVPEHAEAGGVQIFNPGSPTERRRRTPALTMGLGRLGGGGISFEIVTVG